MTEAGVVCTFALSSTARTRIVAGPAFDGVNAYSHEERPYAGRHVAPPSSETSIAATAPPTSVAVPPMRNPFPTVAGAPAVGDRMVATGRVVSVDAVGIVRPAIRLVGVAPRSASTLRVACCMRRSGIEPPWSFSVSSPQAHCTVPAPNTSAPLAARCIVRWCVAVPLPYCDP